jgi:protein CpxP
MAITRIKEKGFERRPKMKKKMFIAGIALLALTIASGAFAQGRGHMGGPGMGYRCDITAVPGLNLSAEQSQKIKDQQSAHWKDVQPLWKQMMTKRQELRQLWLEKSPNQAKIEAKQSEIRGLRDQLQAKQTQYRFSILNQLTPEQREKLTSANWGCPRMQGGHMGGPKGGMMGGQRGQGMGPGAGVPAQ